MEKECRIKDMERINPMLGAIIGDVVGSVYEWDNIKTTDFPFFAPSAFPTDDTIMTCAVADAILLWDKKGRPGYDKLSELASWRMRVWGRLYPGAGYGGMFRRWLSDQTMGPYGSWGNGSAMRISPVAMAAADEEECVAMAEAVTRVTHDHPEGIKGAVAVARLSWALLCGADKGEAERIGSEFYDLDFTLDEIRPGYTFQSSCQGTVPPAVKAYLESHDFESSIRSAISLGGDSDTLAAITGAMAASSFPIPQWIEEEAKRHLDKSILETVEGFSERFGF